MGGRVNDAFGCGRAIVGAREQRDVTFAVRDGHFEECRSEMPSRTFPADRLVVPGFINGHSHAYQTLLRGWADDWTFARWRTEALYRVVPQLSPEDVYWVFAAAFSEMLAAGITTVAEFFYLNGEGNARAEAAIAAARDTGIRLILARTWMDAPTAPPAFRETIEQAAERTMELKERFPDANVCVAPHSLHAASPEMIRAAAAFARANDCAMHIHVAEAEYEGEQTLAQHGATPIALLDRLGALDERTVAIHAIYVTADETRLLAERGARVIHCPTTNQYLGDGTCDVVGLRALGVTVGLGTDADVKPSLIDEMRAASMLQKLVRRDGSALGASETFAMGTTEGAAALGVSAGDIAPGLFADFVVLDATRIDPWSPAVNALVYRGESAWVQATYVNGRRVYSGGPSPLAIEAAQQTARIAERLGCGTRSS